MGELKMQYIATDPRKEYLKQGVMTASPAELVAMLYDACIKYIRLANISYDECKDICAANNYLIKAQKVISELSNSLDMSIEISSQLLRVYDFMLKELMKANARKDMSKTEPIVKMLESMRDTWREIAQQQRKGMLTENKDES